jgi:hypothetical protein
MTGKINKKVRAQSVLILLTSVVLFVEFGCGCTSTRTLLAEEPSDQIVELLCPQKWQVFQRETRMSGSLLISGRVSQPADRVQARILGRSVAGELPGEWVELGFDPITGSFAQKLSVLPGGWYTVVVQAISKNQVIDQRKVDNVGCGEVFIGTGQSNSTNHGEARIEQTSGMVAAFDGVNWQFCTDPQPGTLDNSEKGSFWPAFGDAMVEKYHVPIGVAVTGIGGTSVNHWLPDGERKDIHKWMMTRIWQLGKNGFRAVLWHQGEADVDMPQVQYYEKLKTIIESSKHKAGWEFPWFVAQATYHGPGRTATDPIRKAQARIWDTGVALEGPDTDKLMGDNRENEGRGIHLSAKGLKNHGQMWAEKVSLWLEHQP